MIQRENRGNLKIPILSSSKQKGTLLKRKNVPFVHYFLENDEEKVLVIENTDNNENREQWAHIFHLKERTVAESFFKSDVKNDLHITLTFEGEKGYVE